MRPEISPFLPSAFTRTSSSAAGEAAAATASSHLVFTASRFCIAMIRK